MVKFEVKEMKHELQMGFIDKKKKSVTLDMNSHLDCTYHKLDFEIIILKKF